MLSGRDLWFFQTHTLSSVLWEINMTAPSHLPAVRTCQPWKGTCGCGVSVHLALSQVLSFLRVKVITLSDALVHHGKLLHLRWASFQQGARATDQCQQIINILWTKLLYSETHKKQRFLLIKCWDQNVGENLPLHFFWGCWLSVLSIPVCGHIWIIASTKCEYICLICIFFQEKRPSSL